MADHLFLPSAPQTQIFHKTGTPTVYTEANFSGLLPFSIHTYDSVAKDKARWSREGGGVHGVRRVFRDPAATRESGLFATPSDLGMRTGAAYPVHVSRADRPKMWCC